MHLLLLALTVGHFELASVSSVSYDTGAPRVVKTAARLFAGDLEAVGGQTLRLGEGPAGRTAVHVGTVDDPLVRQLASEGRLDVTDLEGRWESYALYDLRRPCPGTQRMLLVAGSDARGAAYGLMDLSRQMGVSPWYWWCDVPVPRRRSIPIQADGRPSPEPSVKYRGIFINDEDFGLDPWAGKTYEPTCPPVGPRTYARVCELLLRLKANHLLPAMHIGSAAFYSQPENVRVADEYGIVIGTSHCEPLGYNNFVEWDKAVDGEWSYQTNRDGILRALDARVAASKDYENIYTVALRGIHDYPMDFTSSRDEKTALLGQAIRDQRALLERHLGRVAAEIPQAFTPYKEVLELYDNGLDLPDDVTIVWPDDNYGYLKRLASGAEQRRSGRSGVYYHISYQGQPHSYTWFSTTAPALMYEELSKAWRAAADRIWIVNCGDIKGCEMQMDFFLSLAFSFEAFSYERAAGWPVEWLVSLAGEGFRDDFEAVYPEFLRLCWSRRPEMMGWGLRKNIDMHTRAFNTDTEFSFTAYNEAQRRIADFQALGRRAARVLGTCPPPLYPVLYETFYYYVKGAELMNRKHLLGQLYRQYVREGRSAAHRVRDEVSACQDSLDVITRDYWDLLGGKWRYIISPVQDWPGMLSFYELPPLDVPVPEPREGVFGVAVPGGRQPGITSYHLLEAFQRFRKDEKWIELFNRGTSPLAWKAAVSDPWIRLDQTAGRLEEECRLRVGIDWTSVPVGETVQGHIAFTAGGREETVLVSVFNPARPTEAELEGLYVEQDGYISFSGAGFTRKQESPGHRVRILEGLGIEGRVAMLGEQGEPLEDFRSTASTRLEYDFWCFDAGQVDVYTYMVPAFPVEPARDFHMNNIDNAGTRYSVRIDDGYYASPYTSDLEFNQYWYDAVQHNTRINKSTLSIDQPGRHTLKVVCGDPGTMVQKIVIDFGGLRRSYDGPLPTRVQP